MKYCFNCGHPLPDFAKFCPICGQNQLSDEEVTEAFQEQQPVEEPKEVVVDEPTKEEPQELVTEPVKETHVEESKEVVVAPVKEVEPTSEDTTPQDDSVKQLKEQFTQSQTKQEKGEKDTRSSTKFKKFLHFVLNKDVIKFSIIFIGALFGLSLLFWIIGSFVSIFFLFKFLLVVLSAATLARMGYLMYKQIKMSKFGDLFNLLLKGSITVMNLVLFILNFILMVI